MPELPEVETIRRDLEKRVVDKKISQVEAKDKKLGEAKDFARFLIGEKITGAERVGKLLIFKISGGHWLLVHLKMTGQLVYLDNDDLVAGGHPFRSGSVLEKIGGRLPNKHTRFIIGFADKSRLFFNDLRRFGYVKIVSGEELKIIKRGYGIEPLRKEFTLENLAKALRSRRIAVKAALLDQKNISGIGNIYADEILFAAGVRPSRRANSLSAEEIKNIHRAAERIIKQAIKYRGTTFSDYVDAHGRQGNFVSFLKVYGRSGEKCAKCGRPLLKTKIGGRGTHYCKVCQH